LLFLQAPNFAFALATRKFREALKSNSLPGISSLDLSRLKHMINAAEPVDHVAIATFYETFRPYGLPSGVVVPTYGLAEHTVFVCSGGTHVLTLNKLALEAQKVEILSKHRLDETQAVLEKQKQEQPAAGTNTAAGAATASASAQSSTSSSSSSAVQTIVGCGFPFHGEEVSLIIVDSDTNEILGSDKVRCCK
jgi:pyruvate/2-oxoacid:ferredoxin oxidoreductase alpha subunit